MPTRESITADELEAIVRDGRFAAMERTAMRAAATIRSLEKREVLPEGCIIVEALVPGKWRVRLDDWFEAGDLEPDADPDLEDGPITWEAWKRIDPATERLIGEYETPADAIRAAEEAAE